MALRQQSGRQAAVLLAVLVVHAVALYWFVAGLQNTTRSVAKSDLTPSLIHVPLPVRRSNKSLATARVPAKEGGASEAGGPEAGALTTAIASISLDDDRSITLPSASIDWKTAGEQAAQKVVEDQTAQLAKRTFSAADRRVSIPMPKPVERSDIPWDPLHGKRAGLTDEGLLFIKLSDKCMIVMVFLACAFGGEIKPEGDLFKDLDSKLDKIRERELP